MASQAEFAASLNALADKVDAATANINAQLAALQAQVNAAGASSPEEDAALARLTSSVQSLPVA